MNYCVTLHTPTFSGRRAGERPLWSRVPKDAALLGRRVYWRDTDHELAVARPLTAHFEKWWGGSNCGKSHVIIRRFA